MIKQFLKSLPERYEFFARIYLNTFMFNHRYSRELDDILKELLTKKIIKIDKEGYARIGVLFDDGSFADLWNENRYYAWLDQGTINMIDGRTYRYSLSRPKVTTMVKMLRKIQSYIPPETPPINQEVVLDKIDKLYKRVCNNNIKVEEILKDTHYIGYCTGILNASGYLSDKNKLKLNDLWKKYSK